MNTNFEPKQCTLREFKGGTHLSPKAHALLALLVVRLTELDKSWDHWLTLDGEEDYQLRVDFSDTAFSKLHGTHAAALRSELEHHSSICLLPETDELKRLAFLRERAQPVTQRGEKWIQVQLTDVAIGFITHGMRVAVHA